MEVTTTHPITLPLTLTDSTGQPVNISVRQQDGYIDSTLLCQAMGKEWKAYYRTAATRSFLEELSVMEGISISGAANCLVETGKNRFQHTWIHPDVAM